MALSQEERNAQAREEYKRNGAQRNARKKLATASDPEKQFARNLLQRRRQSKWRENNKVVHQRRAREAMWKEETEKELKMISNLTVPIPGGMRPEDVQEFQTEADACSFLREILDGANQMYVVASRVYTQGKAKGWRFSDLNAKVRRVLEALAQGTASPRLVMEFKAGHRNIFMTLPVSVQEEIVAGKRFPFVRDAKAMKQDGTVDYVLEDVRNLSPKQLLQLIQDGTIQSPEEQRQRNATPRERKRVPEYQIIGERKLKVVFLKPVAYDPEQLEALAADLRRRMSVPE